MRAGFLLSTNHSVLTNEGARIVPLLLEFSMGIDGPDIGKSFLKWNSIDSKQLEP